MEDSTVAPIVAGIVVVLVLGAAGTAAADEPGKDLDATELQQNDTEDVGDVTVEDPSQHSGGVISAIASALRGPPPWAQGPPAHSGSPHAADQTVSDGDVTHVGSVEGNVTVEDPSEHSGGVISAIASALGGPPPWAQGPPAHPGSPHAANVTDESNGDETATARGPPGDAERRGERAGGRGQPEDAGPPAGVERGPPVDRGPEPDVGGPPGHAGRP